MGSKRTIFLPNLATVNSTLEPEAFKVARRYSQRSFQEDTALKLFPIQGNSRADTFRAVNLNCLKFFVIMCLKLFGSSAGLGGQGNPANGILVGPGGPTGIIGRPYYGQGYPQHGFGGFGYGPQANFGFEGQHNGLGPFQGSPYGNQFGGPGGFQGPLFDKSNTKNLQVKKIEKSAK